MRRMTVNTINKPGGQAVLLSEVDREVLAALPTDERELIERVMHQHPELTVEKAVKALRAFSI
jgi:hypothetical protein